jgi:hypothetical protein
MLFWPGTLPSGERRRNCLNIRAFGESGPACKNDNGSHELANGRRG